MKKDIKYIIKRIIIGVGIAIVLMFIKGLPVFAQTPNYFIRLSGSSTGSLPSLVTEKNNNDVFVDKITLFDKFNVDLVNSTSLNAYYILFYSKNDNKYYLYYFGASNIFKENLTNNIALLFEKTSSGHYYFSTPNLYNLKNNEFLNYSNLNGINLKNYEYGKDYSLLADYMGTSMYMVSVISENSDNTLNLQELYSFNKQTSLDENNISVVQTNLGNLVKFKNNILYDLYQSTPPIPTGFEKIDMFNKYSIVFYAKDFRKLEKICSEYIDGVETDDDGNVTVIPNKKCSLEQYNLLFYYNGDFNTSFANLENMTYVDYPYDQLPFNPDVDFKYDLPLKINTSEFGGAIIFYNNSLSQNTDKDGNVTTYYDKGYIYYNADLFDYYFVDDYDSDVDENISYIDSEGNEHNVNIKSHPGKYDTLDNTNYTKNFSTSFMEKTLDTFTFIKSNLSYFFNSIPDYFYYFIITILIIYVAFIFLRR